MKCNCNLLMCHCTCVQRSAVHNVTCHNAHGRSAHRQPTIPLTIRARPRSQDSFSGEGFCSIIPFPSPPLHYPRFPLVPTTKRPLNAAIGNPGTLKFNGGLRGRAPASNSFSKLTQSPENASGGCKFCCFMLQKM